MNTTKRPQHRRRSKPSRIAGMIATGVGLSILGIGLLYLVVLEVLGAFLAPLSIPWP